MSKNPPPVPTGAQKESPRPVPPPPRPKGPFSANIPSPPPIPAIARIAKPRSPFSEANAKPSSEEANATSGKSAPAEVSKPIAAGLILPARPRPSAVNKLKKRQRQDQTLPNFPLPSTRPSMPSSIDITASLDEAMDNVEIHVDENLAYLTAGKLFQEIANVCAKLQPDLKSKQIRFVGFRIMAGDEQIGEFDESAARLSITIPLDKIGYTLDTIPLAAIINEFKVSANLLVEMKTRAASVAIVGRQIGTHKSIKLVFQNQDGRIRATVPQKHSGL